MDILEIPISKLKANTGQIEGLPGNPRLIKDDRFNKLVKSIQEDPEMLELREPIVYPLGEQFIVIAGNMRLKAMAHLKFKSAKCKVLHIDTPLEKLQAYTIKDNVPYGENDWDKLAEWDGDLLQEWGMDLPVFDDFSGKNEEIDIDGLDQDMVIKLKYTEEDYLVVKDQIAKLGGTPEQIIWELLGNE